MCIESLSLSLYIYIYMIYYLDLSIKHSSKQTFPKLTHIRFECALNKQHGSHAVSEHILLSSESRSATHISDYIYIYMSISLSLSIYIYIYSIHI